MPSHHHRSGSLKQSNKKHKQSGGRASKRSVKAKEGGKVNKISATKAFIESKKNGGNTVVNQGKSRSSEKKKTLVSHLTDARYERLNKSRQLRDEKKTDLFLKKRLGSSFGPTKIVTFIPLSRDANVKVVMDKLVESAEVVIAHNNSFIDDSNKNDGINQENDVVHLGMISDMESKVFPTSQITRHHHLNYQQQQQQHEKHYSTTTTNNMLGNSRNHVSVSYPNLKQRFTFICSPSDCNDENDIGNNVNYERNQDLEQSNRLLEYLELSKISDVIVFVSNVTHGKEECVTEEGDMILSALRSQGMPGTCGVIQGIDTLGKEASVLRKHITETFQTEFGQKCKIADAHNVIQLQRAISTATCPDLHWRKIRSYAISESVQIKPFINSSFEEENQQNQNNTTINSTLKNNNDYCSLEISAYIRGKPLSVNQLVALQGMGTYKIKEIYRQNEPCAMKKNHIQRDLIQSTGILTTNLELLATRDPSNNDFDDIVMEANIDPLANEQTMFDESEFQSQFDEADEAKIDKFDLEGEERIMGQWFVDDMGNRIAPDDDEDLNTTNKNLQNQKLITSNMLRKQQRQQEQANKQTHIRVEEDFMLSANDDNMDSGPDFNEDELLMLETSSVIHNSNNLNNTRKNPTSLLEREQEELEFPDEVDVPLDIPAKTRFARYRALKSFRNSTWDPKENLPSEYSRVYSFRNWNVAQQRVLLDGEHVEKFQNKASVDLYSALTGTNVGSRYSKAPSIIEENDDGQEIDMDMDVDDMENANEMMLNDNGFQNQSRTNMENGTSNRDGIIQVELDADGRILDNQVRQVSSRNVLLNNNNNNNNMINSNYNNNSMDVMMTMNDELDYETVRSNQNKANFHYSENRSEQAKNLLGSVISQTFEGYVASGTYVTIVIDEVPRSVVEEYMLQHNSMPLILFSLLKHENKLSVLHFNVQKHPLYTEPLASKENLVLYTGIRRWEARAIFSEPSLTANKHKYSRFLHDKMFGVLSAYGPITLAPAPLLVFRETKNEAGFVIHRQLVATGSLLSVEPDRVILKKIILTGSLLRIRARRAVVKNMFYNADDVRWFKPAEMYTKQGASAHILEPIGTHGLMKIICNKPLRQNDEVCLPLYKRIYPKFVDNHIITR